MLPKKKKHVQIKLCLTFPNYFIIFDNHVLYKSLIHLNATTPPCGKKPNYIFYVMPYFCVMFNCFEHMGRGGSRGSKYVPGSHTILLNPIP